MLQDHSRSQYLLSTGVVWSSPGTLGEEVCCLFRAESYGLDSVLGSHSTWPLRPEAPPFHLALVPSAWVTSEKLPWAPSLSVWSLGSLVKFGTSRKHQAVNNKSDEDEVTGKSLMEASYEVLEPQDIFNFIFHPYLLNQRWHGNVSNFGVSAYLPGISWRILSRDS